MSNRLLARSSRSLVFVSPLAVCAAGIASTLNVPGDYPTIQSAINAAAAGDEVVVAPGTYSETIDFLGKDIVVRGELGPENTILDGTGLTSSLVRCVSGEPATAKLEGFTLRKGWAGSELPQNSLVIIGGGLAVVQSSPTIENCHFINNRAPYGGGAYFYFSQSLVKNCLFHSNRAYADGGGAQAFNGAVVFEDCDFTYNLAVNSHGGGVHLTQGSPSLIGCTLANNTANIGGGITFYATDGLASLIDCAVVNNIGQVAGGFWVRPGYTNFLLVDTEVCNNNPSPYVGRYTDGGGNVFCSGCPGDLNNNGVVDSADVSVMLGFWGFAGVGIPVAADLDNSGTIDGADLMILLGNWGACQP